MQKECSAVVVFLALVVENPPTSKDILVAMNRIRGLILVAKYHSPPKWLQGCIYDFDYVLSTYTWTCGMGTMIPGTVGTGHGINRLLSQPPTQWTRTS